MLRLRVNWTGLNNGFSVLHFGDAAGNGQVAADAVEDWLDGIRTQMATVQNMVVDTEVEEVDPATGQVTGVESVTTILKTGQQAGEPVPQVAQALVRWRTGQYVAGREIRGRTFIPGLGRGTITIGGELTGVASLALQNASTAFVAASGIGVWSPARATFQLATVASVWNEFAVMRSRRD